MNLKIIILISLILSILSMACVCASDNQTLVDGNLEVNDVKDVDIEDNIVDNSSYDNNNFLSKDNGDSELSASNYGSRDELNTLVENAKTGSTINLDKSYQFSSTDEQIEINKSLVIDGKGHTIKISYKGLFILDYPVSMGMIELRNINFEGGFTHPIHVNTGSCAYKITNCNFTKTSNSLDSGSIYSDQILSTSYIINCTFKNCYAYGEFKVVKPDTSAQATATSFSSGGALYIGSNVVVSGCKFESCSAGEGGAIRIRGDNSKIIDCIFYNNCAGRADAFHSYPHGGAIHIRGNSNLIQGCTFTENHADRFGGAISSNGLNNKIDQCIFNSNYIEDSVNQYGGAIYVDEEKDGGSISITNCSFTGNGYDSSKNHYCKYGGAIYFYKHVISATVLDCNFTSNAASKYGGAIHMDNRACNLQFLKCVFTKNSAPKYGGAIYLDAENSTISGCSFYYQPNAIYCDNKQCEIIYSAFLSNDNYDIWSTKTITVEKNWFGNTLSNRNTYLAKTKGKAYASKNLYWVADLNDTYYVGGMESTITLDLRPSTASPSLKGPFNIYMAPIPYTATAVNAKIVSDNNYFINAYSSVKFISDTSKTSGSVTIDCCGIKITINFNMDTYSLTALKALIYSSGDGIINLTHNYTRVSAIDGNMNIQINKNVSINGNGYTINSNYVNNIFNVARSGINFELYNLNLVNCKGYHGGAVDVTANNVTFNNCSFINCTATGGGGAISISGENIKIINSTFINTLAYSSGGALKIYRGNYYISDCIFINSTSRLNGAFFSVEMNPTLKVYNSIFLTNSSKQYFDIASSLQATFVFEYNWFGDTNENITEHYNYVKDVNIENWVYLNVTAPTVIMSGLSTNIDLKFYSINSTSNQKTAFTRFKNLVFNVKLLQGLAKISRDYVEVSNGEGNILFTSSSYDFAQLNFNYFTFNHTIGITQYAYDSFLALQYLINSSDDVVNLTNDYKYYLSSDYKITEGILINKDLTINGNNHVINARGFSRIFNLTDYNIVLNNISFINGVADKGGAIITALSTKLTINQCTFENNTAENGGSIYLKWAVNAKIDTSVFKNNSATAAGGAIYYDGNNIFFSMSGVFINNNASDGGAVYLHYVLNYEIYGNFTNNTAKYGGAISTYRSSGNLSGIYQNNKASQNGGAVYMTESYKSNNITGEFYNNTANNYGSAICAEYIGNQGINTYNSIFIGNGGGKSTVYASGRRYLNVYDSILINNNDSKILDTSSDSIFDAHLKSTNNWFGNTIDNISTKPNVGSMVELNDWLFLDASYSKTDIIQYSKNNISFTLKSYDAKKGTVSDYKGNIMINMSLKSDKGSFNNDSFILSNDSFKVIYIPDSCGEDEINVFAKFLNYYNAYKFSYNVVEQPSDSFSCLQEEIDNMDGNVLNLTQNYKFYVDFDNPNGLIINKSITINGCGFSVDGCNMTRIFNILADNVVLQNIALINGNDINGSAIYASGKNIIIKNSILLNNSNEVIYSLNSLNADYNWWGNTASNFNQKANVGSNVIVDEALFATLNAKSTVEIGKNTTVTLNLTNLYNFYSQINATYLRFYNFTFNFNATGGNINVTSDKLHDGIITLSFEPLNSLYGEIYAKYNGFEINHEFEIMYDDDSFTALYILINKTNEKGIVNLTHDYRFYYYDGDYVNGIPINKTLTINANGFNISGMNQSSIFAVSADNVSLVNINFYDAINAVYWMANNGIMDNILVMDSNSAVYTTGSNLTLRNSNFTNISQYCLYFDGSNSVVDNCEFKNNSGPSIFAYDLNKLNIINSLFEDNSEGIHLEKSSDVTIANSTFYNQNNKSICILDGSTVYLSNNNLSASDYIFNNGTILSKTQIYLNGTNLNYHVGEVFLLNATIYDDNGNIILIAEFNFKIDDEIVGTDLNYGSYEYLWTLTNGTWLVVPYINETLFTNCTIDSLIVNVLKYNSSVAITSISDVVYGEKVFVGFEFENTTSVLVTVTLNSEVVYNQTTTDNNISFYDLSGGLYKIVITTLGNEYYESNSATSYFRVFRAGSSLTLEEINDFYYGEDLIINFTVENRTSVIASIYDKDNGEFIFNGEVEGNLLTISNISVGSYSITLSNIIDQNYNPSGDYASFNVLKTNSAVEIDNKTDYIYGNVVINYTVDNLTDVLIVIYDLANEKSFNFTTTNSTISLDLNVSFYQITIINNGTDDVYTSSDYKVFYVLPANSSVEIEEIGDVYYGNDFEVYFNVTNATNVRVIVKDKNNTVIYQNNNVTGEYFDLSDLAVGEYTVVVYNDGSENYNPSNATMTFNVLAANSSIEFDYSQIIYYGQYFLLDYNVENETVLNICIYDSNGNIIYNKNFDEINELPDDLTDLTENDYVGLNFFIYGNLTVGNYTFEFTNIGNSNISGSVVSGSFEVKKTTSAVEIFTDSIVYGEDLEVHFGVVNATTVNMLIKDNNGEIIYNENVTDSPVVISDLAPGNYTIVVTNYDTDNIIGNSSTQEVYVYKINSTVKLNNISDIHYEDDVVIEFEVENETIVNVKILNQYGDVIYDVNTTLKTISISDFDVGNYTVIVTNLETEYVSNSSDFKSFNVLKRNINISVIVDDNVYGDLTVVNVISDIDGLFTVNIADKQLVVSVVDGYGLVMINLDVGNYTADINYTNDNYAINITNSSFKVIKANVTLSVEVLDKAYTANVTGIVTANADGDYEIIIGNYTLTVTVKYGLGSFNLGILNTGNYTAYVIFNGTENYNYAINETTFKVTPSGTNFNIIANSTNISFPKSVNITQQLPDDATGNVTYFFADGTLITVLNVKESFVLSGLKVGSYVIYANYSGDSNYAPAMDSLTITVNKGINVVIISADNVTYPENVLITVEADADDNYTIIIGDKTLIVTVLNGKGNGTILLDAGDYIATTNYYNSSYESTIIDASFTVLKGNVTLSVEVLDKVYTANITGNVFASVDGEYIVIINDTYKSVNVKNGIGTFDFGILEVGNYTVQALYLENTNYNFNSNTSTFKVTSTGTNFNILLNTSEITYGETINVSQRLPENANGTVTYKFANGTIIKILNVSESFVLSGLNVGSYVIYANYSGDLNYDSALDSATIVINKAINNVIVSVDNVIYPANVTITIKADIDGIYNVSISGKIFNINVVNGSGNTTIPLEIGDYFTVTSFEIPNYETNISEAKFSVLPIEDYDFTIEMVDKTVIIQAPGDAGGNITIIFNNQKYVTTMVNGTANITVSDLIEGSNIAEIIYSGDGKYSSRTYYTDLSVKTQIIASDMTRGYNSGVAYQVKIVDKNGNILSNKSVTFTVNGIKYVTVSDANGIAKFTLKLAVGTYKIKTTFDNTSVSVTKTLKIVKRFSGNKNIVKYYNSNFKYKFRVIGDNGKAVGKGVKVSVKIGKKTHTLKTDKNGYITIRLSKKFVPKTYVIKANYKGYVIKNKIKIKQVIFSKKVVKVKKSARKLVLSVKLKQGKKVLKKKKVAIKFRGKAYKAKTNKKGVAKVSIKRNVIKKLRVGKTYKFSITYLKDKTLRKIKVRR